jgi:SEC-C motif-containing protein
MSAAPPPEGTQRRGGDAGGAVNACPCGRGPAYAACCGRWHAGVPAPDAESLMRSRYSAFVRGDAAYLRATWHPEHLPRELRLDPDTQWLGLEVRDHQRTGPDTAEVEFVARSRRAGGRAHRLHERSRFVRVDGRWLYTDGDVR